MGKVRIIVFGTTKIDEETIGGVSKTVKMKSSVLFIAIEIKKF